MSTTTSSVGEAAKLDPESASYNFLSSSKEKKDIEGNDSEQENGSIEASTPNDGDYPKGATLFILVLALSLGTFMMALDNVCDDRV